MFIFLDTETTGTDENDRLCQIAFKTKTYIEYSERPVVRIDQSLKLLRIAKSRITKLNGKVPDNMVFIHGDALQLPFEPNTFHTIISLNLMHVLDDINKFLAGLRNVSIEEYRVNPTP